MLLLQAAQLVLQIRSLRLERAPPLLLLLQRLLNLLVGLQEGGVGRRQVAGAERRHAYEA